MDIRHIAYNKYQLDMKELLTQKEYEEYQKERLI